MNETTVRFPDVEVRLVGEDGNVFAIVGRVQKALRRAGATPATVTEFADECFAQRSYPDVLETVQRWVVVA